MRVFDMSPSWFRVKHSAPCLPQHKRWNPHVASWPQLMRPSPLPEWRLIYMPVFCLMKQAGTMISYRSDIGGPLMSIAAWLYTHPGLHPRTGVGQLTSACRLSNRSFCDDTRNGCLPSNVQDACRTATSTYSSGMIDDRPLLSNPVWPFVQRIRLS